MMYSDKFIEFIIDTAKGEPKPARHLRVAAEQIRLGEFHKPDALDYIKRAFKTDDLDREKVRQHFLEAARRIEETPKPSSSARFPKEGRVR